LQVIKGTLANGTTQRNVFCVRGTPSSPFNFECMTTIEKLLAIFWVLCRKDGSFLKRIKMKNIVHC
jgi:hypothetical protein